MTYRLIDEEVSISELEGMVHECSSYDGSLEEYYYYENDEEFFTTRYNDDIMSAVRAVCYGEYNYMDDYVRVNGYGNLDSRSSYDYKSELMDNQEEIVERYAEMLEDNSVSEFKHLFEEVDDE